MNTGRDLLTPSTDITDRIAALNTLMFEGGDVPNDAERLVSLTDFHS